MKKLFVKLFVVVGFFTFTTTASAAEFGLFGDVNFSTNTAPGATSGFAVGGLDFYATTNITDDTQIFVEYVFEDGGDGLVTDLERLWIGHTFNDNLMISVGRFHTPLGVWNRSYHHGTLLQDTASRPFFLDFEDGAAGILPVHIVGLLATGSTGIAGGELNYEVYFSNGSSIDSSIAGLAATPDNKPELDINVASDPNNSKSSGARATYEHDELPITIGAMYMSNKIAESDETGGGLLTFGQTIIDQTILGFDMHYDGEEYLLLAEFYSLNNDAKVGDRQSHNSTAYYLQLGYKLDEENRILFRHASLDFDTTDSYYLLLGANQATHNVVAFRSDLDATNAIKFEINRNEPDAGPSDTTYTVQWSFLVP